MFDHPGPFSTNAIFISCHLISIIMYSFHFPYLTFLNDVPQNLKEPTSSVEYFVIGCAALIDSSKEHANAVPKGSSLFFWADFTKEGGFAVVRATVSYMTLEFVDAFGSTLFTRVLQPRDHQMYLNGEKGTEQDQGKV